MRGGIHSFYPGIFYASAIKEFFCLEGWNPFYLGEKAELRKFRDYLSFFDPQQHIKHLWLQVRFFSFTALHWLILPLTLHLRIFLHCSTTTCTKIITKNHVQSKRNTYLTSNWYAASGHGECDHLNQSAEGYLSFDEARSSIKGGGNPGP